MHCFLWGFLALIFSATKRRFAFRSLSPQLLGLWFYVFSGWNSGGSMHGSITRSSVHSCRWNKGRIWGDTKPSEYQRLSQNESQMQARVSQVSLTTSLSFFPFPSTVWFLGKWILYYISVHLPTFSSQPNRTIRSTIKSVLLVYFSLSVCNIQMRFWRTIDAARKKLPTNSMSIGMGF